ncbi:hypothetical protein P4N68_00315 [Corynebacterium felinum]|uniref:Secreted protein n=1 Tax=Corynebacterium felinum TaxID=131318 RepID=A0ABU2BBS8_9CORY|nr:hypothetical protein [Corynebacterium felinum]MDF5819527.1 hypothetical protein [Corynebacterium felinum]MDR7356090.1 hypothetical protein [Corynebacterium felinum]WJY95424.1 hypothetical protein CFELI_09100 [Corynebacterium felinum]
MKTLYKKTAVAVIAASALVLAACGSEDATSSTPSTKAAAAAKPTGATSKDEKPTESPAEVTKTEDPAPSENAEQPPAPAPEVPIEPPSPLPVATHQPVAGGGPASPEDAAAIEGLIRGIDNQHTLRGYMKYIPDNTCRRVIDANGGQAALTFDQIPDLPLEQYPGFATAKARIDNVAEIKVDGEAASALVTASASGETNTAVQRFVREDGRWLFCD